MKFWINLLLFWSLFDSSSLIYMCLKIWSAITVEFTNRLFFPIPKASSISFEMSHLKILYLNIK